MTISEAITEGLKDLPPEKQQEVLDFVAFLRQRWKAQGAAASVDGSAYPLRGSVLQYDEPFEPAVPIGDWDVLA